MTKFLQIIAVLAALALPAFAQNGQLSPDDQRQFDKAYSKYVNDTRKNDRDDIARDVQRMQEIMARNNIPANVPYEQVASAGQAYSGRGYQGNQLSPQDQKDFDKYYTKWLNDTRKNDRDDVQRDTRKMQEIMSRYNIPPNVPFDQVASTGYANQGRYDAGRYGSQNAPYQTRLSPEDQRDFDRYYSQWQDDSRRNDQGNAARDMEHMRDIMARYNISPDVPFDQIATAGAYPNTNDYGRGGYGAYGQPRLSPDDQREFDKAYSKWVKDNNKNDRDDIGKDTRKMQDIMARYNIPSNVPYDQIASPNAQYQH